MNIIMANGLKKILNSSFLLIPLLIFFLFLQPSYADVAGCPCVSDADASYYAGLRESQQGNYLVAYGYFFTWASCVPCTQNIDNNFLDQFNREYSKLFVLLQDYILRGKQSYTTHSQTGGGVRMSLGVRKPRFPPAVIRK